MAQHQWHPGQEVLLWAVDRPGGLMRPSKAVIDRVLKTGHAVLRMRSGPRFRPDGTQTGDPLRHSRIQPWDEEASRLVQQYQTADQARRAAHALEGLLSNVRPRCLKSCDWQQIHEELCSTDKTVRKLIDLRNRENGSAG